MDLTTITVQDFKNQFPRNFPYLPVWSNITTYNKGAIVYYTDGLFYQCLLNGTTVVPTNPTNWVLYDDDVLNYVLDSDIQTTFGQAQMNFYQGLGFGSDANVKLAYLYLCAYYLCVDMLAITSGLQATASFPVSSRTVGSISESYQIPDYYKDYPLFANFAQNQYGQKYLNFIIPLMVGNVGVVCGTTLP